MYKSKEYTPVKRQNLQQNHSRTRNLLGRVGGKILRVTCGEWLQGNRVFQTQQDWHVYDLTKTAVSYTGPVQVQVRLCQHWEKEHAPKTNQEDIWIWYQIAKEKPIFFKGISLSILTILHSKPMLMSVWPRPNEHSIFVDFWPQLDLMSLFLYHWSLVC